MTDADCWAPPRPRSSRRSAQTTRRGSHSSRSATGVSCSALLPDARELRGSRPDAGDVSASVGRSGSRSGATRPCGPGCTGSRRTPASTSWRSATTARPTVELRTRLRGAVPAALPRPDAPEDPQESVVARETSSWRSSSPSRPAAAAAGVLILRDVLGCRRAKAADALELTVASVTSALQRARVTMREQLPTAPRLAKPRHPRAVE